MAIQMRRGNEVDFDAEKMLPGEWAVSTDAKIVRMCFRSGVVVRMATYEAFEADMGQIHDILVESKTVQEAVQMIQEEINDSEIVVEQYAKMSKSYAVGGTGSRDEEDTDNAKYYYDQTKRIAQGVNGIVPMGTITFEELPTEGVVNNAMYNISNSFTSDARFNDGGGVFYGAGNNVLWTATGKWDVTAASGVTGIKGEKEDQYRQGNVNITRDNIGLGDDVIGTADISAIGDGTVKGAIKEIDDTRQLTNYINIGDIGLDTSTVTFADFVAMIPDNSMYSHSIWKSSMPSFEFPDGCGNYCYLMIFKGTTSYVNAILMDLDNNRIWNKAKYGGVTTAWNSYLPLTGGTLSGSLYGDNGHSYLGGSKGYGTYLGNVPTPDDLTTACMLIVKNYTISEPKDALMFEYRNQNGANGYRVFGEHNKPSGSYIGNGSATDRTIDIGGIHNVASVLMVSRGDITTFITHSGAFRFVMDGTYATIPANQCHFRNGILTMSTENDALNASGITYHYTLL